MNLTFRYLLPILIVFIVLLLVIFLTGSWLTTNYIDRNVLLAANFLFFFISLITFLFQKKSLKNANPHVFVRSVMGSMMLKMFICIAAISIYAMTSGDDFNKRAVFIALFFYLIYLTAEVISLLKMNKHHA